MGCGLWVENALLTKDYDVEWQETSLMNEVIEYAKSLCEYSYCIDANYAKGTTFKDFLVKHRRQLIIKDAKDCECKMKNEYRIRKLTPKECWRLMGFSDDAFNKAKKAGVSNSQLYKQAGNSIVTDVLYYIFKELYKAMPYLFDDLKVGSYFSGIGAFEIGLDRLFAEINDENFTIPQVSIT